MQHAQVAAHAKRRKRGHCSGMSGGILLYHGDYLVSVGIVVGICEQNRAVIGVVKSVQQGFETSGRRLPVKSGGMISYKQRFVGEWYLEK